MQPLSDEAYQFVGEVESDLFVLGGGGDRVEENILEERLHHDQNR